MNRNRIITAILLGGLVAGAIDITYALVATGMRGVPPMRLFQFIAAGVLGRESFDGGLPTAILGGVLHFAMTTIMAAVFVLASRIVPLLLRWPLIVGPLYGIAIYVVMNYVVVPLSLAPMNGPPEGWIMIGELASHIFGVGLPIALIAKRFASR